MPLSAGSGVGQGRSRLLNRLSYDVANKADDITTAATGDRLLMIDVSDNYLVKYADAANVNELLGFTTSAAEVNVLAGVTAGTVTASKALVVDANKDISSLRNVSVSQLTYTGSIIKVGRQYNVPLPGNANVGATAGWVITGRNVGSATLPASQTGSTLVVPILGLGIGDQVTAVSCVGQVESGGNAISATMDVRKTTTAAADLTDASIGSDTVTVSTDTALSDATGQLKVTGLTETVAADEFLYVLITATTAASTDLDFQGLVVTVTTGS